MKKYLAIFVGKSVKFLGILQKKLEAAPIVQFSDSFLYDELKRFIPPDSFDECRRLVKLYARTHHRLDVTCLLVGASHRGSMRKPPVELLGAAMYELDQFSRKGANRKDTSAFLLDLYKRVNPFGDEQHKNALVPIELSLGSEI